MSSLAWTSWLAWGLVVVAARLFRSLPYAIFRGVTLGLHTLIALPLLTLLLQRGSPWLLPALVLHGLAYFESLVLIRPALRPIWYRVLVSWPAMYFTASMLLAFPWAIAVALGFEPYGAWLPFLLGAIGLFQSLTGRAEARSLFVGDVEHLGSLQRVSESSFLPWSGATSGTQTADGAPRGPLRIVQITDPHLGPFMPISRLRAICQRAVDQDPDLVLLTGDFLTMESQSDDEPLARALAPLQALRGRTFACMGNHDHEAPAVVKNALHRASVQLLVDSAAVIDTANGPVQIVGFDFHFSARKDKMQAVCDAHPRLEGVLRLALLHDPSAFKHLPPGQADLVLSGHTHGGQVGLVSLGWVWTVAGWVAKIPDHGLWGRGQDRLYVHRGTGHYGFPLRLGVPAEESLLSVYFQVPRLAPGFEG